MQIRLKCSCGAEECREWAIIELQGVVESHPSIGENLQNLEIGRLCCVSKGNYTFTVGYHELSGTKVALKKPLLVLRKKKVEAACESDYADPSGVELEVIGIIRDRIIFKTRPKALISKPQVKDKKAVQ
ncbi:chromosome transmission fidelity protein 8 homolog isoform X2 [Phalaenopsis equestris]|uniref:chromosome transmission fidelity protein 8 homolog n=1 Tax=Phalaenopsis equestris TaxID=78828 RepID=UPI0009E5E47E|nr:chromosome transmission fidelity protein 8 homolog [Phalaenopsis equestris]XP_020577645.1 chromosome transmission fidelity protein 8 homolog [Phalaenopsis equestris]XP_020592833.1 chromosome transmission fidelity protein 8 homolog isoform X2 [Phalaenopsis equestris]